jgi:hypothetical protein
MPAFLGDHRLASLSREIDDVLRAEFSSMGSRRAAGGGALGRSRWRRGLHPSRHGRLPLRSRRPACAAQPTARDGSAATDGTKDQNQAGSSLGLDRLTPGRRHQERFASLTRSSCARLLTPTTQRYVMACTREPGECRQRGVKIRPSPGRQTSGSGESRRETSSSVDAGQRHDRGPTPRWSRAGPQNW